MDGTNTLPHGNPASVSVSVNRITLHFTLNVPQSETGAPGEVSFNDLNNAMSSVLSQTSNNTNGFNTLSMTADINYNRQQIQDVINKLTSSSAPRGAKNAVGIATENTVKFSEPIRPFIHSKRPNTRAAKKPAASKPLAGSRAKRNTTGADSALRAFFKGAS